jgi:hypothetical protein
MTGRAGAKKGDLIVLTAVNDYFRINFIKTVRSFSVMFGLTLVGQVILAFQTLPKTTILIFV